MFSKIPPTIFLICKHALADELNKKIAKGQGQAALEVASGAVGGPLTARAVSAAKSTTVGGKIANFVGKFVDDFKSMFKSKGGPGGSRTVGAGERGASDLGGEAANLALRKADLLKSKASYQKLITEHQQNLETFKMDPIGNSSAEWLKQATRDNPTSQVLLERAMGRASALEKQLKKQLGELNKINEKLEALQ